MESDGGQPPSDVPSPEEKKKLGKLLEAAMRFPEDRSSKYKFYYIILGGAVLSIFGLFVTGYLASVFFNL